MEEKNEQCLWSKAITTYYAGCVQLQSLALEQWVQGIAQVCAQSGWQTRLFDAFPESLEKGME